MIFFFLKPCFLSLGCSCTLDRFRIATVFDQPLNNWNVISGTDFRNMFRNTGYSQNLCDWGPLISSGDDFSLAFADSSCPIGSPPDLTATQKSPLCHFCNKFVTKGALAGGIDNWISLGPSSVSHTHPTALLQLENGNVLITVCCSHSSFRYMVPLEAGMLVK